ASRAPPTSERGARMSALMCARAPRTARADATTSRSDLGDLLARSAKELARFASVTGQETALASSQRVVGLSPVIIAVGVLLLWRLACTTACLLAVFREKP